MRDPLGQAARRRGARRLRRGPLPILGAALLALAACGGRSSGGGPVPPFDAERAWAHAERIVGFGPRPAGSEELERLRAFLTAELESYGLQPQREAFSVDTPVGPIDFANLYADVEGRSDGDGPAPLVILGTHIDTKRLPFEFVGANDGAAGTAVLLELARVLASERGRGPVTYRVLFLDGEESMRLKWEGDDNRYGSRHHVERLRETDELVRVRAFVLLDLVGDRDLELFQETQSDAELVDIFFSSARRQGLGMYVDGPRQEIKDDHLSFIAAGIPSVDLIDFDYGPRNAYWHTDDDTLDKLSAASLEATGRIVLGGLPRLERWVLER